MPENKKQLKHTVTYRDNQEGLELYNWVEEKGKINGAASFIRQVLYEKMLEEKKSSNLSDKL